MKTTFESFISITLRGNGEPITEFDESFFKRNPDYKELFEKHVPTGEIAIISGSGFNVLWSEKHDCDCEYCDREENRYRFFDSKIEAEKEIKKLERVPDEYWDIELEEGAYFVKAVKQNLPEGLFNG